MSRTTSFTVLGIAVALLVIGLAEHLFFRVTVIPHLAIILGIIAVLLAAWSLYSLLRGGNAKA